MLDPFESVKYAADAAAHDTLTMSFDEYVDDTLEQQLERYLAADARDVREINRLASA